MPSSEGRDLHQQILESARRLFIEQGYHGLAMRQIAESLGVTKAALYYHFKDKEELFLAVLDEYLDENSRLIDRVRVEGGSCRKQVRLLVESILSQPAEQRALIRLSSQEMAQLSAPAQQAIHRAYREKFLDKIQSMLKSGIERGELRPVDPGVAAWVLLGMMYPYTYPAHTQDMPPPLEVFDQILTIYLDGLALTH
jgi:AcrR family transcriptional regulator